MRIDWSIDIGSLLVMLGGIVSFLWGAVKVRDSLRDMQSAIGNKKTGEGLWGAVVSLQEGQEGISKEVSRHRDWLIEINAALDPPPVRINRS